MILDVNEICSNFDSTLATFIHNVIVVIKIAVPIVLVILGMLDLGKGVVAAKEDEIKKGQHTFIKRLLAGVVVFFMISIVQLVTSFIDKESNGDIWSCANAIMNGKTNNLKRESETEIELYKKCCEENGGHYGANSGCVDSNGGSISDTSINSCILSQYK